MTRGNFNLFETFKNSLKTCGLVCRSGAVLPLQGCPVSDRIQVPTAAKMPLKRKKTVLICVGGLVGVCVCCFPASPASLCPALLLPVINEWSGSVSPCSLQKVLFAPLSAALLLILWYSLLLIFYRANCFHRFPSLPPTPCAVAPFPVEASGTKFWGENTPLLGWIFPVEILFASHYPNNNFKFFS